MRRDDKHCRIDEFVGRVSATLQHHLLVRFMPYLGIDPNFAAAIYSFKIPSNTRSEICEVTKISHPMCIPLHCVNSFILNTLT